MDSLIGQNLGRYHVIEPLGQGGMASVYKAFDTSLERNVAIKIIRNDKKEGTEQNEFLKRFQREAKALAQLDHPYILKVLDYGEQDGMPFLVMPFVQGGTLKEKMGRPMPFREAAALLAPIAHALDYAHKRKIIHRDVKPANILISETNTPLLSDFGIAKILESGESTQLTATGVGIGTPDYMAPEQWLGKVDPRTDIYSLGIVFFQMVTGHLPYSADTPAAVLIKHMQDPLPRPRTFVPELPEAVEQVIFKALNKEPETRFQDMGAFADALGKLAQGDQASLTTVSRSMETVRSLGTRGLETVQSLGTPGLQTVLATLPGAYAPLPGETVLAPAGSPPAKKRIAGWLIAVIVVAVIAVGVLLSVLAGGAYFALKMAGQPKATSLAGGGLASSPGVPTLPQSAALQPTSTQNASSSIPGSTPTGTPFASIQGYPADLPFLKDNNGDLLTSTTQGMTMYHFTTSLGLKDAAAFYLSGMDSNGWQKASETTQTDMYMWTFTKGDSRQVMISVSNTDGKAVQVSIIIQ